MNRMSVGTRLSALLALVFVSLLATSAINLVDLRNTLFDKRKTELQHLVEGAVGTISQFHDMAAGGALPEEEARRLALEAVKGMRYDGGNYFWINDLQPRVVMHPAKPALDGTDASKIADPNGKRLFVAFAETAKRDGAGIVDYMWPKPGAEEPVAKLSYVQAFKPWGWVVGTGAYVDDIEAAFMDAVWREILKDILNWAALSALGLLLIRSITRPLAATVREAGLLAAGDTGVRFSAADRGDEIGAVARSVAAFRDQIADQQKLAEEARVAQQRREERQARIEGLINGFRESVAQRLGTVRDNTASMRDTARELTGIAEQSSVSVRSAVDASGKATENIQAGASATQQLTASIGEISQQVSRTSEIVSQATTAADRSNDKVASLAEAATRSARWSA